MDQFDVEFQNVTKRFGATVALDGVSLSIRRGEFLTLLGPSGCGKTTLLRLIAGFERPDEGVVLLDGADVTDLPAYRRNVHTVFQHYALFPHLSVARNVSFGLERKGLSREKIRQRIVEALDLVRLPDLADRMPSQLSGGQQQRVALARALVLEPRVLLLDEPLAALDRKLRETMQLELKDLQRRLGISFVFVTHDQDEALAMSDRIAVMNGGRIEHLGTPTEVYERPRTRFTADFVGVSNILEGQTTLAVRPEKIRFVDAATTSAVSGTVESARYLGDVTHWHIRLDDGAVWIVYSRNDGISIPLAPGSRVGLAWDDQHAVPLGQ